MTMTQESQDVIKACVRSSHEGTIHFGTVVAQLMAVDVESYHVDYRQREHSLPAIRRYVRGWVHPTNGSGHRHIRRRGNT